MRRGLLIAASAAALWVSGCDVGGDDSDSSRARTGELARYLPDDAFLYGEVVLRPDDDLSDGLETVVETLGGSANDLDVLGPELLDEIVEDLELPSTADLEFEDDVRPWLGDRAAVYVSVPTPARQSPTMNVAFRAPKLTEPGAAGVVAVTDTEAARDALEEALPEEGREPREGTDFFYADEEFALALVDDRLVAGTPGSIEVILAVDPNYSLAERGWFRNGLETLEAEGTLGFLLIETRQANALAGVGAGPRIERLLDDPRFLARAGVRADVPTGIEFLIQDDRPALEVSYGVLERPDLANAFRLVSRLPADSWAAVADPAILPLFLESFAIGVKLGLKTELGGLSPREIGAIVASLGYDPLRALRSLGDSAAVYARGPLPDKPAVGLVIETDRAATAAQPVDAIRFLLASLFPRAGVALERPPGPQADRIVVRHARLPYPLVVEQRPNTVMLRLVTPWPGRPPVRISETGRFNDIFYERLGARWDPLGYIELQGLIALAAAAAGGPIPPEVNDLSEAIIDVGGRYEDGVYTMRLQLSPIGG